MKKLFFLFSVFCTVAVYAQKNKLDIGIAAGPNSSSFYGYTKFANAMHNPLIAFSAGLTLQYHFPKIVSVVSGIFYEQKGQKFTGYAIDQYGSQMRFKHRSIYNYMTLPLLARFSFGKKVALFAEAGGFISYLTNSSSSNHIDANNYINNNSVFYKDIDAGVTAGIGVALPIGEKLTLSVNARNNLGLTNISIYPMYRNGVLKTNTTNLLVGLSYKLAKRNA